MGVEIPQEIPHCGAKKFELCPVVDANSATVLRLVNLFCCGDLLGFKASLGVLMGFASLPLVFLKFTFHAYGDLLWKREVLVISHSVRHALRCGCLQGGVAASWLASWWPGEGGGNFAISCRTDD